MLKRTAGKISNTKVGKKSRAGWDPFARSLPTPLETSFSFLERYAIHVEGIFRVSAAASKVLACLRKLEKGKATVFDARKTDPHIAAGVVKLWLCEMDSPLLMEELHDVFILAYEQAESEAQRLERTRMVTQMLPPCHRAILERLLKLCHEIQGYRAVNKMTATNLAIVFAPMVFQYSTENLKEMIRLSEVENKVFEFLVMNAATVMQPVRKQLGGVRSGTSISTSANKFNDGMRSAGLRLAQSLMQQRRRGIDRVQPKANKQRLRLELFGSSQTELEPKQGEVTFRGAEVVGVAAVKPVPDTTKEGSDELTDVVEASTPGEPSPKPAFKVGVTEEAATGGEPSPRQDAPVPASSALTGEAPPRDAAGGGVGTLPLSDEIQESAPKRKRSTSKSKSGKIETEEERKARRKAKKVAKKEAKKHTGDDGSSGRKRSQSRKKTKELCGDGASVSFELDLSLATIATDCKSPRKSGRKSARSSRSTIHEENLPRRPHTSRTTMEKRSSPRKSKKSSSKSPRRHHQVEKSEDVECPSKVDRSRSPRKTTIDSHSGASFVKSPRKKSKSRSKSPSKASVLSPRHHSPASVAVQKADSCETTQAAIIQPVVVAEPLTVDVTTVKSAGIEDAASISSTTSQAEIAVEAETRDTVRIEETEAMLSEEDAFAAAERQARKDAIIRRLAARKQQVEEAPAAAASQPCREESLATLESTTLGEPQSSRTTTAQPVSGSPIDSMLASLQESTSAMDALLVTKSPTKPRQRATTEIPAPVARPTTEDSACAAAVTENNAPTGGDGSFSAPKSPVVEALSSADTPSSGRRRRRRGTISSEETLEDLLASTLSTSCARSRSSTRVRPALAPSDSVVGRSRSSTSDFRALCDAPEDVEALPELEPIICQQIGVLAATEGLDGAATEEMRIESVEDDGDDVDDYFSHLLQGQELEQTVEAVTEEEEQEEREEAFPKYAEIEYTDGSRYEGMITEDYEWTGRGKCFFADGDFYEGEVSNNSCNGVGTLAYNNGDKYTGQFVDGERHGSGVYVSNNGDVYEGEFLHNCRSGFGTYRVVVGDVYVGYFKDGVPHGKGEYSFATGDSYKGEFIEDVFEGEGTYVSAQGSVYVGAFHQGVRHGIGRLCLPNGDVYEGEFAEGKFNGEGVYTYSTGYVMKATFENGKVVKKEE